jgi:hypothetical protein
MIRIVGRSLLMIHSIQGGRPMTLTIAARWRVTLRVQSLARVTFPSAAPKPARAKRDIAAMMEAQRFHIEMEEERRRWATEAMLTFPRMY